MVPNGIRHTAEWCFALCAAKLACACNMCHQCSYGGQDAYTLTNQFTFSSFHCNKINNLSFQLTMEACNVASN